MKSVLIIEDNKGTQQDIENIIKKTHDNLYIYKTEYGEKAIEIARTNQISIFFVDIKLKGMKDGIQTVYEIQKDERYVCAPFIYISNLKEKELMAYRSTECQRFIRKPIDEKEVQKQLLKAIMKSNMVNISPQKVQFTCKGVTTYCTKDEIVYIESVKKNVCVYIYKNNKMQKETITNCTMNQMLDKLVSKNFVLCHRSFIINTNQIDQLFWSTDRIKMKYVDKDIWIPIGGKYRGTLKLLMGENEC